MLFACLSGTGTGTGTETSALSDFESPITATWNGIGLREWAGRMTQTAGVPVLADRRLDPDTAIRLECRDEPLLDVITRGAAIAGGEVAALRSSLRIVPKGRATVILRAEAARETRLAALPPRQREVLQAKRPLSWPAGSRPRDLLTVAASEEGITVHGLDRVPHDHLPAVTLPDLTLAERLDLLLAFFDLRIDWQAATGGRSASAPGGTIIPIDAGLPAATAAGIQAGTKPLRRRSSKASKPAVDRQTFSLEVAAPLQELLATIAKRLGLALDLDRESLTRKGIAPGEIVRATVKDASRDELLDAILAPLGLTWTITGESLRVFAAPNR